MPTLRLFANLREIAGAARLEVEQGTVAEVLEEAARRFGPHFANGLRHAQVWRNGEPAAPDDRVGAGDELALIPPVSGGTMGLDDRRADLQGLALVGAAALLVASNIAPGPAWWATALVGIGALWAVDVVTAGGGDLPIPPILASVAAAAFTAHALGTTGLGMAMALAPVMTLSWAVAVPRYRHLPTAAGGVLVAVLAAGAVGSLLLTRNAVDPGNRVVAIFLAMAVGATLIGLVAHRLGPVRFLDPVSIGALVAVMLGVVGAVVWELDVIGFLLIGVSTAVGLIAGRGLGSMLRTGQVTLVETLPGPLAALDGPMLAATLLFPLVRLLL